MRLLALILLLWPIMASGQSSDVKPGELALTVSVEDAGHTPMVGEQVMLTIRGVYRRHITRETLIQPDLEDFNWSQLGPDSWKEERLDGQLVKVFTRRMALYPGKAGPLEIGPFTHRLTLTDEGDDWFEHQISSNPITVDVSPAPQTNGWWFPVQRLEISDQWSNAPDQLKPGEGVLRVIRLEAHGATPEMIPPMPELKSPSAMIFPHPPKRLVELTPNGPVTYAFWRWTIRPGNDVSAIVEPITVSFFDTTHQVAREVRISPQRIAYGDVVPDVSVDASLEPAPQTHLPGMGVLVAGLIAFLALLWLPFKGQKLTTASIPRFLDPLVMQLMRASRRQDVSSFRMIARSLIRRDPERSNARDKLLKKLDYEYFDPATPTPDLRRFAKEFISFRKG